MRALTALLCLTLAAACGFQPMYAPLDGRAAIGPVHVDSIPGRAGHVLKTELDRILAAEASAGGEPMRLGISLRESIDRLGIRIDESASRAELRLVANYILDPPQGRTMRGSVDAIVTFDIPTAAFGEIAAQDDARERAAETLAQRLRAELAMRVAQARAAERRQAEAPPGETAGAPSVASETQ